MSREGLSPWAIGAALVAIGLGSVAAWYWFIQRAPVVEAPPQMVGGNSSDEKAPEAVPVTAPPPKLELPPLEQSDEIVRELARKLSDHPKVAEWLVPRDLVRRFVATIDNIARGGSPRPHLLHMEPGGSFQVSPEPAQGIRSLTIDPATYRRYDLLTEVFTSLDIGATVRLYYDLQPLLDQAYGDLGDPSRTFAAALDRAMERLINTPIPEGQIEVEKHMLVYRFAEPQLEGLSPAQKHLIRLGPENARKVQSKLTFLRSALDLEL